MSAARLPKNRKYVLLGILVCLLWIVLFSWKVWLVQTYQNRAQHLLDTSENKQALEPLRAALRLMPERAETHLLFARTYRRLGAIDNANAFLRRAQILGAESERVEREKWLVLAQTGRLREAEPHLPELLTDSRGDGVDICAAYVQGYFSNLQFDKAHQLLDLWQNQYPLDAQPYLMRGNLFHSMDQFPKSVAAFRQGLALAPGNTFLQTRLAEVLIEQHAYEEAHKSPRQDDTEKNHPPE